WPAARGCAGRRRGTPPRRSPRGTAGPWGTRCSAGRDGRTSRPARDRIRMLPWGPRSAPPRSALAAGGVQVERVVSDHAVAVEQGGAGGDAAADALHPAARDARCVAVAPRREDLLLEGAVERRGVVGVLLALVRPLAAVADLEA